MDGRTSEGSPVSRAAGWWSRSGRARLAGIAAGTLATCVVLTLLARQRRDELFQRQVAATGADIAAALQTEVRSATAVVAAVSSFFEGSTEVSPAEFQLFARRASKNAPEMLGVEWQPKVPAAERAAFEEKMRAQGAPGFTILDRGPDGAFVPAAPRPFHLPVVYAYPPDHQFAPPGFDRASVPERMAAKLRAIEESEPVASLIAPSVTPKEDRELVVTISDAVLAPGEGPARDRVRGFAVVRFSVDTLLAMALRGRDSGALEVTVHDMAPDAPAVRPRGRVVARGAGPFLAAWTGEISVPGRTWFLRVAARPGFFASTTAALPWFVFAISLLGAALVVGGAAWQISARERAARETRARLELGRRLHEVVDRMAGAVVIANAREDGGDPVVGEANEAALVLAGHAGGSLQGCNLRDLLPGGGAAALVPVALRVWQSGTAEHLPPARYGGESEGRWLECRVFRLASGEVAIAASDLTALKNAEAELLRARSDLDLALDASQVGLWTWEAAGRTVRVDARCAALADLPADQPLTSAMIRGRVHPEDLATVEAEWRDAAERQRDWEFECRFARRDGTWRRLCSRGRHIRDRDGRIGSTIACAWDVTDRRRTEEHLQQMQRLESLGTLAGGLAHDLNNALAPLTMGLDLLRRRVKDDADAAESVNTMIASVRRAASIVAQLVVFTRGARRGVTLVHPTLALEELRLALTKAFRQDIEMRIKADAEAPLFRAEPAQVQQILLNLCLNARDAMPQGGRLEITCQGVDIGDAQRVDWPELPPGRYTAFRVTDTGSGIPASIRGRIFDPFFTTKETGRGTGLGLSTALGIARACRGSIHVESKEGAGSTFTVLLPAATDILAAAQGTVPPQTVAGPQGRCVLVVDDETPVREMVRSVLESEGYRVLTAADGTEAVAVFARSPDAIDLVLMDLVMPVMNGVTATAAIRRIRPNVPVVVASGYAADSVLEETRQLGVTRFLAKPFEVQTLLEVVRASVATPPPRG